MSRVKLSDKLQTSRHAFGEGHTCYIFQRVGSPGHGAIVGGVSCDVPCDPFFQEAWETCKYGGSDAISNHVVTKVDMFEQKKSDRKHKQPDRFSP